LSRKIERVLLLMAHKIIYCSMGYKIQSTFQLKKLIDITFNVSFTRKVYNHREVKCNLHYIHVQEVALQLGLKFYRKSIII
jgi:hypothetical protein